jgi:cyclopropane fatty-acyl-phospholipid synthase-like methyltransferase
LKGDHIKAIEFGCGTGASLLYLANLGWTTVGIDIVEKARNNYYTYFSVLYCVFG